MKELTLVWNRLFEQSWEVDWVEYLFRNIPHTTVENPNRDQFFDNCVIIDTIRWSPDHDNYVRKLESMGYNFAVIDLADELRNSSTYSYTNAKFVLRNYYRPGLGNNVLHIPLGYNVGFTLVNENPSAAERAYTWSFVGQRWDNNREAMKNAMEDVKGGLLYRSYENQEFPKLNPKDMSSIYRNSIFVPSPAGWWVIDSFRVTEALEAGCIPIVERNEYWEQLYKEPVPFIQINAWHQAPAVVNNLLNNPEMLEQKRQECYNWWCAVKDRTTREVENLVKNTMLVDNETK